MCLDPPMQKVTHLIEFIPTSLDVTATNVVGDAVSDHYCKFSEKYLLKQI